MTQDTIHDRKLHLQRIDEKMARLKIEHINTSEANIDLEDEREVTKQCLRICKDAKSYVESLSNRESALLSDVSQAANAQKF
jgi:hypothetical protein